MLVGIVEGFYNRVWTASQRQQLFADLQQFALGAYLYAPKDDLKHRRAWRAPYEDAELGTCWPLPRVARGCRVV